MSARALAWIALVPWLAVLRSASPRGAAAHGLLFALAMSWTTGDWLPDAVAAYFHQPLWLGFAFLAFVALTMAAPYFVAFALAYRALARRYGLQAPLLVAAAWTAMELARGRLLNGTLFYFGSTPWATFGYSQAGFDELVQVASLTGVYGISFALVAVNAGVVEVASELRARRATPPRVLPALALAAAPALAALAFGVLSLRAAPELGSAPGAVRVAIVQGNLESETRWRADMYGQNLERYLTLTRAAVGQGAPEVVFWPEAAMTFFVEREPAYRRALGRVLAADGVELVAGAPRADANESRYWNSVYLLAPDGEIVARYDKQHLVPFMEYFPLGIDLLRRSFARIREFTPGQGPALLPTRAGAAGILVCNEAMLPHFAGRRVAEGAAYLVNPSNDTWAPGPKFALQMFDIVALRAVEQRRYLVRASTSGPSAVVDPWGRVQERTAPTSDGFVLGTLGGATERSLYGRVGDTFGAACALAALAALVARRAPRS